MKQVIKRNLDLEQKYIVLDKKYIPMLESFGTCCENCGRLISNIATVKGTNDKKVYNIGFDCLETILINNSLLSKFDIDEYYRVKPMFAKIIRISKDFKSVIAENKSKGLIISEILIERPKFEGSKFVTIYYVGNFKKTNSYIIAKNIEFKILVETLQNILTGIVINIC